MATMVEVSNLKKSFGPIVAVDDISFAVGRGEVLGFLGPNGAGKSTTMKMITGFLTPDNGTVKVGGDDVVTKALAVKRRLGYLPEGAPLYSDMTTAAFLDFVGQVRGLKGDRRKQRIGDIVDMVNLSEVLEQPIETLSKGFKRRVGLAQAILHDPEVLILDEPTDGLDPNQKHEVRSLIKEMAPNKTIILSTHILEEVDAVCNRAMIIAHGQVLADGTPAELEARDPYHNAVTLELSGKEMNGAVGTLETLPSVAKVEKLVNDEGRIRLRLFPNRGKTLAAAVSQAVQAKGWQIAEFHVEQGRLDHVFRDITAERPRTSKGETA